MDNKLQTFKNLLDHSQDGFFCTDHTGNMIYWNSAMELISEIPKSNIVGQNVKNIREFLNFQIDPKYDFDAAIANLPNFFKTGEIKFLKGLIEMDFITPHGVNKKLELSLSPLVLENNSYGLVASFRDITSYYILLQEKEFLIEELNEVNKTKDKFFSIIAHDLKTPLNAIIGFSELISSDGFSLEEIMGFASQVNKSAYSLLDLLNNLLEWSMFQTGKIKTSPEFFDLDLIIKNQISICSHSIENKGIFLTHRPGILTNVFADHNMISTVVRNLITNAIKFTKPIEGKIIVSSRIHEKTIEVCISDNGIGMSDDIISKLFQIGEDSIKRDGTSQEKSSGLGLILCKEFIEQNGGKIWVESLGENKGSSFYFTVPRIPNY
ncbi:PAS domain-containing protein [Candidatus Gracilibacteria bacterium]|nr:PAS domain-containing protein [Candidatus Gracilibacteria bacterium]